MTGETITEPATLTDHLREVNRTGVATEHDEAVLGESSVAAPVFDATDWPSARSPWCSSRPTGPRRPDCTTTCEKRRVTSRGKLGAPGWPVYQFDRDSAASA